MTQTVKSRVAELARQGYSPGSIVGMINSERAAGNRQTTMASVKVMLSQLKCEGLCAAAPAVSVEVSLSASLGGSVAFEAAARGLPRAALIERLVATVVQDDLWNAVLDDGEGAE